MNEFVDDLNFFIKESNKHELPVLKITEISLINLIFIFRVLHQHTIVKVSILVDGCLFDQALLSIYLGVVVRDGSWLSN